MFPVLSFARLMGSATLMAILLALTLAAVPTATAQTASLTGTVIDAVSDTTLRGASVRLPALERQTYTEAGGTFRFRDLPAGTYSLEVTFIGYGTVTREVTLTEGERTTMTVRMQEGIIELEEYQTRSSILSGQARAINQDRASQNIVDIISSDAFGDLPDKTVAEAVSRLPGITVEDDQGRAEARYVTIRGMNADFNSVQVNGNDVTVSNFDGASRSVPLDSVPSKNAAAIEVTKSIRPDQEADSIGGSINIRTPSVFDREGRFAKVGAEIGYSHLAEKWTGNVPGYDDTPFEVFGEYGDFLNEDRTLGVYVSANYRDRPFVLEDIAVPSIGIIDDGFDFPGERVFHASRLSLQESFDVVEQTGVTLNFEFHPTTESSYGLDVNYSLRDSNLGSQRADLRLDAGDEGQFFVAPFPTRAADTLIDFTVDDRAFRQVRDFYEEQEIFNAIFSGENIIEDLTLSYSLGMNYGYFGGDADDTSATFQTGFMDNYFSIADRSAFRPVFSSNITDTPSGDYFIDRINRGTREVEDLDFQAQVDVKRDMDLFGLPGFLKAGLRGLVRDRDFDDIRNRIDGGEIHPDVDWTLDGLFVGPDQIYGSMVADYNVEQSFAGTPFGFMVDPAKVRAAEAALRARSAADGINYFDDPGDGFDPAARDRRQELVNSYDATEQVFGTYLMGQVQNGPWTILAGFRVEYTSIEFDTYRGDFFVDDPTSPAFIQPVNEENDYWDFFPHLHLRYDVSPDTILRFSVNRSLARPSYFQLNPAADVNTDDLVVTVGDTQLDPTESWNVDFDIDHTFWDLARVTFGVFYKSMDDNVYRLSRFIDDSDPQYGSLLTPGDTYQLDEFRNAKGAEVFGTEISLRLPLEFLASPLEPFTFFGNLTWTDSEVDGVFNSSDPFTQPRSSVTTPLFGQVPLSYRLGLDFVLEGFEATIAYSWRSEYLRFGGISEDPRLDEYNADRQRLDLSAGYTFESLGLRVYAQFQNVLDNTTSAYWGNPNLRMLYEEASDWSAYFGVTWTMN